MATIEYKGQLYSCEKNESVLDALLRQDAELSYGCRAGACQACMLKLEEGAVPEQAQRGLKDTQKSEGYFLACSCYPEQDIKLDSADELATQPSKVVAIEMLSDEVTGLSLTPAEAFEYRPGQFINIHKAEGVVRSYSLASVPALDEPLQLHVRRIEKGVVSGWIHDQLKLDDEIEIDGPYGECFYMPGDQQQPILMIGSGTGLAPLYGILRDALQQGHKGDIHLYHGSREPAGLYLQDELKALAAKHDNVHYLAALSSEAQLDGVAHGRALDLALQQLGNLKGYRVYLCGNESMVQQAKKRTFLAGANMKDILADPFTVS